MTNILCGALRWVRERGEATTSLASRGMNACGATAGPIDSSPTIDQAISGGYPWLEIECSRCKAKRDADLAALRHVPSAPRRDAAPTYAALAVGNLKDCGCRRN
jgi:hypothetical protein